MESNNSVVLDKISALLKEHGKKQKNLCEYLALNQQAYTNWKNGSNDSYMKYLPQIAEYFGVTIDYLLGNSPREVSSPLPADLAEIIETLSDAEMEELRSYVHFLISKREK